MAKDFSKAFYNSRRWRKNAKAFAESKCWICSRCHNRSITGSGTPRMIVHHKTPLTPENIHDDSIAYGWDNLELLCIDCHNAVHAEGKGLMQTGTRQAEKLLFAGDTPHMCF